MGGRRLPPQFRRRAKYECAFLGCLTGVEGRKGGARAFCLAHRAEENAEDTASRLAVCARKAEA